MAWWMWLLLIMAVLTILEALLIVCGRLYVTMRYSKLSNNKKEEK